jgi:hypothetical protein
MAKRVLMVVIAAAAISISSVAGAAGSNTKHKHRGKAHTIAGLVSFGNINPPGAINVTGRQTYAGTVDVKVGGVPVSGAIRGRNRYKLVRGGLRFTGRLTIFLSQGSLNGTLNGKGVVASASSTSLSGSVTITSGAGIYRGVKGSFRFKGTAKSFDGDGDELIASLKTIGTLRY